MGKTKRLGIFILVILSFTGALLFGQSDCLSFDGSGDYVQCGGTGDLNLTVPFTIEVWVNPSTIPTTNKLSTILSKKYSNATQPGYALFINSWQNLDGTIHFETQNTNLTGIAGSVSSDGDWKHIAIAIEAVDADNVITGSIYVNGDPIALKTGENKCNLQESPYTFALGGMSSGSHHQYKGSMDEVRIWNVARTKAQIEANMHNQLIGNEYGLKAYYRLDKVIDRDDQTTILNSAEGDGLTGTITGATWASYTSEELIMDQPLPVTLSSFTAITTSENLAQLNWETQSESNLLGFNIYRSESTNLNNSVRINGSVLEPTNTSMQHSYSFLDENVETDHSYSYWLESVELDGGSDLYGPTIVEIILPGSDEHAPEVQVTAGLQSIYPNPFNPETTISYYLAESAEVTVEVYNLKGQLVKTFHEGSKEAETHYSINWNAKDTNTNTNSSGIYFIKLKAGNLVEVKRAVLIK